MGTTLLQIVLVVKTFGVILLLTFVWASFEGSFALAQVTTTIAPTTGDGSLGTTVTTHGHITEITGGSRPGNRTNLFHSFDTFSIGQGDAARFLNTTPSLHTENILTRVTGGNPSSIFGTIDTTSYSGANLFLMNPAGIIFGPTAMLNVGGSVTFTTADYLQLAEANGTNAGIFHAAPTATSLLTSASVAAFGFLRTNPSAISVQGTEKSQLRVQPGHSISLVGGSQGFASTNPDTGDSAFIPDGVTVTGGHLLAPDGQVNITSVASPGEILAGTWDHVPNINGLSFGVLGTVQISKRASIDTSSEGGGRILIRGGHLVVDDSKITSTSGDVLLDGTSIRVTGMSNIKTETTAAANAGHITLQASRDIEMDFDAGVESSASGASKDAGNIALRSNEGNITFANGAFVTSQALKGGRNTGSIEIEARHGTITLDNNSFIFTHAELDTGTTKGTHGGIQITATDLQLLNRSAIDSDNFSAQVTRNVVIHLTGRLNLTGGSQIQTSTTGSAAAADIVIKAGEVVMAGGSSFTADTFHSGAGGNIFIDAGRQLKIQDSRITTEAKETSSAKAGDITIQAIDRVTLSNSEISTSVRSGAGKGGNITIDPNTVILQNNSTIFAQAKQGSGGDITIRTPVYLIDQTSRVNADSRFGLSGTVTIQSPTSNLSGTVGQLVSKTSPPQVLLQNRCVALAGGGQSTFLLAGRDALPTEPGGWLNSPVSMEHVTGEGTEQASGLMVQKIVPNGIPTVASHEDEPNMLSLRRLTPPGFLVRTFATGSTGCPS